MHHRAISFLYQRENQLSLAPPGKLVHASSVFTSVTKWYEGANVVSRVAGAVRRIGAAEAGRDIVVVAHGGSIRAALAHALSINAERALGFAIDNCSLTRLDHFPSDDAWRVSAVNYLPHIQPQSGRP